jgi:hypothetical protein
MLFKMGVASTLASSAVIIAMVAWAMVAFDSPVAPDGLESLALAFLPGVVGWLLVLFADPGGWGIQVRFRLLACFPASVALAVLSSATSGSIGLVVTGLALTACAALFLWTLSAVMHEVSAHRVDSRSRERTV